MIVVVSEFLVPDARVMDRGFHEITLVDMGDTSEPDVFIADLSLLRLQWPIPVVSSLSWLQPELEQLCHRCKKSDIADLRLMAARIVERGLSWTWLDTWQTTT